MVKYYYECNYLLKIKFKGNYLFKNKCLEQIF